MPALRDFEAAETVLHDVIEDRLDRIETVARSLPQYLNVIQTTYRLAGKPELAASQFEKIMRMIEGKIKQKGSDELTGILRELRDRHVALLIQSGKTDEAAAILDTAIQAARKALKEKGDDAAAVLQLANLLRAQAQLLAKTSPENEAAVRAEHIDFLSEQAKEHPENAELLEACLTANFRRISGLARTSPVEAEKLLKPFREFVRGLDGKDLAVQARVESASRFINSVEQYISLAKKTRRAKPLASGDVVVVIAAKAQLEARGVDDRGGHSVDRLQRLREANDFPSRKSRTRASVPLS